MLPHVCGYALVAAGAQACCKHRWGHEMVAGSPRWIHGLCLLNQSLVFPALLLLLLSHAKFDLSLLGARNADLPPGLLGFEREFGCILFLYWMKDFQAPINGMFVAHHCACFLGLFVALVLVDRALGWGLLLIVVFELGGATMNMHLLYPGRRVWATLYLAGMSASNIGGIYADWMLVNDIYADWPVATGLNLVVFGIVTLCRQRVALVAYRQGWEGDGGAAETEAAGGSGRLPASACTWRPNAAMVQHLAAVLLLCCWGNGPGRGEA